MKLKENEARFSFDFVHREKSFEKLLPATEDLK